MSEDTNDVSSASSPQQMVPKERLDELIADRKRLEEQLNVTTHLLRQTAPQQQNVPQQEDPEMAKLREENPVVYAKIHAQEQKLKQISAANFAMMDNQDRMQFVQTFGEDGMKYLQKVEGELQRLRAQGQFFDRAQIYTHLRGTEAIQKPRTVAPKLETPTVKTDVPSQDPKSAGTIASSSAASTTSRKTIEEMERDLENFTF